MCFNILLKMLAEPKMLKKTKGIVDNLIIKLYRSLTILEFQVFQRFPFFDSTELRCGVKLQWSLKVNKLRGIHPF